MRAIGTYPTTMRKLRIAFIVILALGMARGAVGIVRQAPVEKVSAAQPPKAEAKSAPAKGEEVPRGGIARREKLIEMRHEDQVNAVAFSPDGKVLASCSGGRAGGRDNSVRFWDPTNGKLLRRLVVRAGNGVAAVAYSPDGKILATANRGGGVSLYDTATDKEVLHLDMWNLGDRTSLAFSPNGKSVAAGCNGEAFLWDLPSGKKRHHFEKLGRQVKVVFAEGGRTLVTGDDSGKLRFWDTTSGKLIRVCDVPNDDVGDRGEIYGLAVSPDGKVVIAGQCCATRLWNAATGKVLLRLPGNITEGVSHPDGSFAFFPDGKTFISGGFDSAVRRWDTATGRELARYKTCGGWYQPVAVSPDGKKIVSGAQDHFVRMWDVQTGRQIAGKNKPPRSKSKPPILHKHDREITALAFSPDGKKLASTGKDGQLVVSEVMTGEVAFETPEHWGGEYAVAWSRDGKRIASADQDGVIRLWDAATGKQLVELKGHKGIVAALAFSPDDKMLASGGYDGMAYLWDIQNRKERRHWQVCKGRVTALSFAPDGKTIATGGAVGREVGGANIIPMTHADKVRLWDVATAKELTASDLRGETVAFSADGRCLFAAGLLPDIRRDENGVSINGQNRIAVVRQGVEVLRISKRGTAAAFSADNQLLATGAGTDMFLRGLGGGNIIGGGSDDPVPTLHLWELATGKEVLALPKVNATLLAFAPDGRTLAYPNRDEAVVLLDVVRAAAAAEVKDPKALCEQLADEDAAIAFRASCSLILGGPEVVALLRERLRPIPPAEAARVKKLLLQLDAERFEEREAASRTLLQLGAAIESAVREAANGRPTLEARRRLETIVKEIGKKRLGAEELRCLRSIRVLEQIGTPDALRVLEKLSGGAKGFVRTDESRAALLRLSKRGATSRSD